MRRRDPDLRRRRGRVRGLEDSSRTGGWRPPAGAGRRWLAWLAALLAMTLIAASCSSGDSGEGGEAAEEGPVTIRFSWWGSDERAELTEQAIAAFEEAHPDIDVEGEFIDWEGYWDRLATATAAQDMPDVLMQEERFLREYASRGALLDLSEYTDGTIDTSKLDPLVMETGQVEDGLYALASGVNVYGILANPQLFADLGVQMPDDATWTWQDYVETATALSQASGGEVFGAQDYGSNEAGFKIYARQQGQDLYNADGGIGFEPATLASWWELSLELRDRGGTPPADLTIEEQQTSGPEESLLGTGQAAMAWFWSNQLGAASEALGQDLVMLRPPGETQFDRGGMFLKPAMAYAVSSQTEHPEAAATFVNFMLNDPAAIDVIGSDRGLPANLEERERITSGLEAAQAAEAEFIADITDELEDSANTPPVGAGVTVDILQRLNEEVLTNRLTPAEAAEQFISEVEAETGN
jgi:multiple sugar transport system substrate-binding protein